MTNQNLPNVFDIYTEYIIKQIQKELPDCIDIDVDEEGLAYLIMNDDKPMMQQEFKIGTVKTLILQWNVHYLITLINN